MKLPDSQGDYAFWTIPGTSFTITYSLELFREIDFEVNEGYRRIPHGGVEVGGVLWGRMKADSVVMEAFRPIECEHALGPSFVLSERDLAALKEQLANGVKDPDLAGMAAVGWFVARTRTALMMLDRDAVLFDKYFPSPGSVTLLVKPERFQPTRFAFIARSGKGQVDRDTAHHAVILPLAGRTSQATVAPVPSIAAPLNQPAPQTTTASPIVDKTSVPGQEAGPELPPRPVIAPPVMPPEREKPTDPERVQIYPRDRQAITRPRPELQAGADAPTELLPVASVESVRPPAPLPSIDEVKKRRAEIWGEPDGSGRHSAREEKTQSISSGAPSGLGFLGVLLLAALLGCGAGYLTYLQLPAAIIQMHVQRQRANLIVFWPADQTRSASYAAIRIDDGHAVPLTPEEKTSGHTEIKLTSDNVKVELIAQHWIRDSRGIVRYVRRVSPASTPASPPVTVPTPLPVAR